MSTNKDRILSYILHPLSWVYGTVTDIRNWFFDIGWLPVREFDVPVVSVGNMAVGGTGKTPHVEMLIELLAPYYSIGVISRGYKRKTRGYVKANKHSTPETIGDEPYQMYNKYGRSVKVAVCENRIKGITQLLADEPDVNLVLLDDAYQHRYVKPKVNILLTDFNRPIYTDKMLPLGRLRENRHNTSRADIVIVTKVPDNLPPFEYRQVRNRLELLAFQHQYFSRINYEPLQPVFPESSRYNVSLQDFTDNDALLLLTGIANPRSFVRYFKRYKARVKVSHFPDHHFYSRKDLDAVSKQFDSIKAARKIIVTTEKDAVRLANNPYFPEKLKPLIFYVPISVEIVHALDEQDFLPALRHLIEKKNADPLAK